MAKTTVHTREGKIEIEIKAEKEDSFTLTPDEAMELSVKLLRAAYAAKAQSAKP